MKWGIELPLPFWGLICPISIAQVPRRLRRSYGHQASSVLVEECRLSWDADAGDRMVGYSRCVVFSKGATRRAIPSCVLGEVACSALPRPSVKPQEIRPLRGSGHQKSEIQKYRFFPGFFSQYRKRGGPVFFFAGTRNSE